MGDGINESVRVTVRRKGFHNLTMTYLLHHQFCCQFLDISPHLNFANIAFYNPQIRPKCSEIPLHYKKQFSGNPRLI